MYINLFWTKLIGFRLSKVISKTDPNELGVECGSLHPSLL